VLAFDFSGCGESDNDRITIAKEIDDLQSAISFVKSLDYVNIALHGHSLGTRVCLECYTPQVSAMVLTGACTGPMKYNWEDHFTKEQLQELEEKGYITEYSEKRKILIDQQMLLDFELVDQKKLLSSIKCPVLIIHGDADEEERELCQLTKQGMKWLSKESRLEVIQGATHSFTNHLPLVEKLATDWFLKYFSL
jgi:pimeloyl-ACP methyl ester carboxylesterase